jgi:hypothetical protein
MSCNSCSNITLPGVVGPAGAVGAQGIQGIQGIQGDPGDPGIQGDPGDIGADGTTVLEVDFTEYIEDQNTFSVVSKSFNIPADSWEVNGDIVELEAIFVTDNTTSGYYQVRVELGTNIIALIPTLNDVYITGKRNFLNLKVQLVLSASGEVTPITESATSLGAWYSLNWGSGTLSTSIYRGPQITGLNTAAIIPLKVYLVSSVTGKNIKMFYYKIISLKK